MTDVAHLDQIDQAVADFHSSQVDPSLAPGNVAAIGSWLLRASGTDGEIFWKYAAGNQAWQRNNLTLKVFNVKNFGATGDGVTNDRPAIQLAINAAIAAHGGTVYFPPGTYAVNKVSTQSFLIENCTDIDFVGDGPVSILKMTGSANFGDWRCFTVRNFAKRINFYNLTFDATTVTNPDPADQLHFIQFQGLGAQPVNSGAEDCEVIGCFFGHTVGDAVRTGAEANKEVSNIRVQWNVFDMAEVGTGNGARSCVGMQRYSNRMNIAYNFMTGVDDQEIDYEPTGGGGNRNDVVMGNICVHSGKETASITIGGSGAVTPIVGATFAFNIVNQGGYVLPSSVSGLELFGCIIETVDTNTSNPALYIRSLVERLLVDSCILYTTSTTASKTPILMNADADGQPKDVQIANSIIVSALGNAALVGDHGLRWTLHSNVWDLTVDGATAVTIGIRGGDSPDQPLEACSLIGNLAVNTGAGLLCYRFATGSAGCGNSMFAGNLGVNSGASCYRWERATTEPFTGFRYCGENVAIGGASASFDLPVTNVGAAFAGAAGPGQQQAAVSLAGGPEGFVAAPAGSICTNYLGSNALTIFYKETGNAETGWLGLGGWDYVWGAKDTVAATTTALFMAPGDSLAAANATEFKITLPRACIVRNLRVRQTAGVGAGTISYTVRVNGVDTAIVATMNFTATTGASSNSRAFAAGDQLSIKITKSVAAGTAPTDALAVLEII